MTNLLCLVLLISIPSTFSNSTATSSPRIPSNPSVEFPHRATLDPAGQFVLHWKKDNETITFRVQAPSKGWAGIGFSPNGGMAGADIIVFWIDQAGKGVISDRYGTENGFPSEDTHQDYTLIDAAKNDTHLIFTFSRKINTCDQQDWAIRDGTTRVLYAWNDAVPETKNNFRRHSVRGSKSLYLLDETPADDLALPEKDAKPFDFKVDKVQIPENVSTTYWCEVKVLPEFDRKVHVIKVDPLIDSQNTDIVHHILVYLCTQDMSEYVGNGRPCFAEDSDKEDPVLMACQQSIMSGWAVGGESFIYPKNMGYPLYADPGNTFIMMEMHYENAQFKKGKFDSSGMRFWITEQIRPIDAGQAVFGVNVDPADHLIPPGQQEFTAYGYCSADCTSGFPKDGIRILGGFLHTHLTGRKVRVLQFRNGKQLPPLIADEHYDFKYQDGRVLKEHPVVLPGDQLVVECVHETLDRTKPTFGGYSTRDEMCLAFLAYYPAVYRGFWCSSGPDKRQFYKPLGIDVLPYNESNPLANDVKLPNGNTKDLSEYLKKDFKFDWTKEKIDRLQKDFRDVKHDVFCLRQGIDRPKMNLVPNADGKIQGIDFFEQNGYPKGQPWIAPNLCGGKG